MGTNPNPVMSENWVVAERWDTTTSAASIRCSGNIRESLSNRCPTTILDSTGAPSDNRPAGHLLFFPSPDDDSRFRLVLCDVGVIGRVGRRSSLCARA